LMHFIYDWWHSEEREYNDDFNEEIAKLMGDITNQFWVKFYERYENTEQVDKPS